MHVHSIPGKLEVNWNPDVKAIVDTWSSYHVTLEQFSEAVLGKGLDTAKAKGAIAWIVDSSSAQGVFTQEIQDFIGSDVFPGFAKNGIKYFITVLPKSAVTKMTVKRYSTKAGPSGIELVEANSLEDALDFLKEKAKAA